MPTPLIYAAIAHHGFGHLAQTGVVLQALRRRRPFRLVVRSAVPGYKLRQHVPAPEQHLEQPTEPGMVMRNALDVDAAASHAAYRAWVEGWERAVAEEAERLRRLRPDLVLANVSPLVCAAARAAKIPVLALCSLNWAEVYRHYCSHLPGAQAVEARLLEGYRAADAFLRPEPSMPMTALGNTRAIGPLARRGRRQPAELRRRLGWGPGRRLVLVSMGGMNLELPVAQWPVHDGLGLLAADGLAPERQDVAAIGATGLSFIDLLASVDAVICKPGYGTVAEAACNGVPMLYTRRGDWPEEPYLVDWLQQRACGAELERGALLDGALEGPLQALWARTPPQPPAPTGLDQAAALLSGYLD